MKLQKKFYPWSSALPGKFAVPMATLYGLGNLNAPGTWGSAAGVALYAMLFDGLGLWRFIIFAALLAYLAVGICDAAERHLKMRDPGKINLDEFVAMPLCFLPLACDSFSIWGMAIGFIVFRFFDIKKPLGINKFQSLEGGVGCVADDIIAALYTAAVLNILALIFGGLAGAAQI